MLTFSLFDKDFYNEQAVAQMDFYNEQAVTQMDFYNEQAVTQMAYPDGGRERLVKRGLRASGGALPGPTDRRRSICDRGLAGLVVHSAAR